MTLKKNRPFGSVALTWSN